MKILSCRIDNFGKFHDKEFIFKDGLTVIKENNGYGKTTLAAFIAGMFYGLPTLKSVSIAENERRRYDPWQGGNFGGDLLFEYGGKRYTVERDFNKKDDAFRLTDAATKRDVRELNGKAADGKNLGEILFGIDKSSYERSAYVPQGDTAFGTDKKNSGRIESGLNEKLRNLVSATDGENNYNKAVEKLNEAIKKITTPRGKGALEEAAARIRDLDGEISRCKIRTESAADKRGELERRTASLARCESEIKRYESAITKLEQAEAVRARRGHYNALKDAVVRTEAEIRGIESFFNGKTIEPFEFENTKGIIDTLEKQREKTRELEASMREEKGRTANIEQANAAIAANRRLIERQRAEAESEKNKITELLADLKKRRQKPAGFLFIIACIFTFGLIAVVRKKKQKELSRDIAEAETNLKNRNDIINKCNEELANLKLNAAGKDGLSELEEKIKSSRDVEERLLGACDRWLAQFNCVEEPPALRYREVKDAYNKRGELIKKLEADKRNLGDFLKDKDESGLTGELPDPGEIERTKESRAREQLKRDELIRGNAELKKEIEQDEAYADGLPDYESGRKQCAERKEKLERDLDILKKTEEFLRGANDTLSSKYLMPVQEKCCDYIKLFDAYRNVEFDAESNIKINQDGKCRDIDYFSAGGKEIIGLCMRFALIDIIFKERAQRPCVVLDDPFVNLDDKKLDSAKDFIRKLSESYQILYLTCHDSRRIV